MTELQSFLLVGLCFAANTWSAWWELLPTDLIGAPAIFDRWIIRTVCYKRLSAVMLHHLRADAVIYKENDPWHGPPPTDFTGWNFRLYFLTVCVSTVAQGGGLIMSRTLSILENRGRLPEVCGGFGARHPSHGQTHSFGARAQAVESLTANGVQHFGSLEVTLDCVQVLGPRASFSK